MIKDHLQAVRTETKTRRACAFFPGRPGWTKLCSTCLFKIDSRQNGVTVSCAKLQVNRKIQGGDGYFVFSGGFS